MDLDKLDDRALIVLYQQHKDNNAIGVLYKRYSMLVFGLAYKYLKREDAAKDLVTDIFMKIMEKLAQPNATIPDEFARWLYIVSRNEVITSMRKNKMVLEALDTLNSDDFMESDGEMRHYIKDINEKHLENAISSLNEEQNKCIQLFYIQDKSYQEVASLTGYDIKKVKSHIQNGKRNLKIILEQNNVRSYE